MPPPFVFIAVLRDFVLNNLNSFGSSVIRVCDSRSRRFSIADTRCRYCTRSWDSSLSTLCTYRLFFLTSYKWPDQNSVCISCLLSDLLIQPVEITLFHRTNAVDILCASRQNGRAFNAWLLTAVALGSWVRTPLESRQSVRRSLCCAYLCTQGQADRGGQMLKKFHDPEISLEWNRP
jgi:hypothetical protein